MSSNNNKGTQYDPPGDSTITHQDLTNNLKYDSSHNVTQASQDGSISREDIKVDLDLTEVACEEDEPQILPPRVTITPRVGSKAARNTKVGPESFHDDRPPDRVTAEKPPGCDGDHSGDSDKQSGDSGNLSVGSGKPLGKDQTNSGSEGKGDHIVWSMEYRNKLRKQDKTLTSNITAHNTHPECFKPPTAATLSRSLTLGKYRPSTSSTQFVVKNEIKFWPSAKRGTTTVGRDVDRVTYSRYATRGTGRHSARLRSDEEHFGSPRSSLTTRKGHIVTNRLPLVCRSNSHTNSLKFTPEPAFVHRLATSSLPAVKLVKFKDISLENLSKPIERVRKANRGHPSSTASDSSEPTPSECDEATGKVRAWIIHRDRVGSSAQGNLMEKQTRTDRGLWDFNGMSPTRKDMIKPLRRAHPLVRSTITVGNFMTDGTASRSAAVRISTRGGGGVGRRQITAPF